MCTTCNNWNPGQWKSGRHNKKILFFHTDSIDKWTLHEHVGESRDYAHLAYTWHMSPRELYALRNPFEKPSNNWPLWSHRVIHQHVVNFFHLFSYSLERWIFLVVLIPHLFLFPRSRYDLEPFSFCTHHLFAIITFAIFFIFFATAA